MPTAAAVMPFAAIRAGYNVAFPVSVGGKEIISRGEVFSIRRIGRNRAEIVIMHAKTGALFTNVVKASNPVHVHSELFTSEPTDALSVALMEHVKGLLKTQMDEFYDLPIEDKN
jgi:hypothetical protein